MNREFVAELRRDSCYPTFRALIAFATAVGYAIAILCAALGAVASTQAIGVAYQVLAVAIGAAVVIGILTAVMRELSLMLADIADATLHLSESNRAQPMAIARPVRDGGERLATGP